MKGAAPELANSCTAAPAKKACGGKNSATKKPAAKKASVKTAEPKAATVAKKEVRASENAVRVTEELPYYLL